MVDDNNPLTPEQMAARIAELEEGSRKASPLSWFFSFLFLLRNQIRPAFRATVLATARCDGHPPEILLLGARRASRVRAMLCRARAC
jgi:hypothetical protein